MQSTHRVKKEVWEVSFRIIDEGNSNWKIKEIKRRIMKQLDFEGSFGDGESSQVKNLKVKKVGK